MQETQVWYLGQEDPLREKMATHCSILAWKIPWTEGSGGLHSVGSLGVGHDWAFDFTSTFHFHALEKEMATHSSILVWRIPWTEGSGGLQSMGLQRVGHDWVTTHNTLHTSFAILICVYKIQVAKVVGLPGGSVVKNLPANAGDAGSIPGSGRSSGGEHGNPLQYSAWEISWTEEPGRLKSIGLQRIRNSWNTEHTLTKVTYRWSLINNDFSNLQWCESDMHAVEITLWILIFSQASNMLHCTVILSGDVGQWQLPHSHVIMTVKYWYT